jgi:hypothetical protein
VLSPQPDAKANFHAEQQTHFVCSVLTRCVKPLPLLLLLLPLPPQFYMEPEEVVSDAVTAVASRLKSNKGLEPKKLANLLGSAVNDAADLDYVYPENEAKSADEAESARYAAEEKRALQAALGQKRKADAAEQNAANAAARAIARAEAQQRLATLQATKVMSKAAVLANRQAVRNAAALAAAKAIPSQAQLASYSKVRAARKVFNTKQPLIGDVTFVPSLDVETSV